VPNKVLRISFGASKQAHLRKCIQNQHTPAATLEATVRSPGRF